MPILFAFAIPPLSYWIVAYVLMVCFCFWGLHTSTTPQQARRYALAGFWLLGLGIAAVVCYLVHAYLTA